MFSCKFNINFLEKTSITISNILKENPDNLQYHIDVNDQNNVLLKFEKIYLGKTSKFNSDEYDVADKISKILKLGFPDLQYSKSSAPESLWGSSFTFPQTSSTGKFIRTDSNVKLDPSFINSLIRNNSNQTFSIITNKQEYKCNIYGILSSSVIREFVTKNPKINEFIFDYDDDNSDFNSISNFFNFIQVQLSNDNVYSIKEIAEKLGIDCILKTVDNFIVNIEKVSQSIDDNQSIIDSIDELFKLLYQIKEKPVDSIAVLIENLNWLQSEEKIFELSSYILQVVNSSIELQNHLIDLILILSKKDEKTNKLTDLIVKQSILLFSKKINENVSDLIILFVYKLYKKGLISKEQIDNELKKCTLDNIFFVSWFLPELIEVNSKIYRADFSASNLILETKRDLFSKRSFNYFKKGNNNVTKKFYQCNAKNIEEYKQMRDKDENDNIIEKALRNDDIDTFQSITSQNLKVLLKEKVKKNIFEPFIDGNTNYLNYAAFYGSIKCFKYLLLNNVKISNSTFDMSISSGNNELIRIVDNERKSLNDQNIIPALNTAIKLHKNDIFDWIIDDNINIIKQNDELVSLVSIAIENANVHSFVRMIDIGFDFGNNIHKYYRFLKIASEKGFYSFALFIMSLINGKLNSSTAIDLISSCIIINSEKVLFQIIDKMNEIYPFDISLFYQLIEKTYKLNKIEVYKKIAELVFQNNSKSDFTDLYIRAIEYDLIQLIKEFIDKKYLRNDSVLSEYISQTGKINHEIFMNILNDTNSYYKKIMVKCIDKAILNKNKPLIKCLLEENAPLDDALFNAVQTNDSSIVEMILNKNSQPSFINQLSEKGTAIIIAVRENNLQIVKQLLAIPGIDPSICYDRFVTPLILSACKLKYEIFNSIVEFYGENIKKQKWQLKKAVEFIIEYSSDILESLNDQKKGSRFMNMLSFERDKKTATINNFWLRIFQLNCINPNFRIDKNSSNELKNNSKNSWGNSSNNPIETMKCTTPLLYACKMNAVTVVRTLLQCEKIDPNIFNPETGDTPLIISVLNKYDEIAEMLINHPKTNINAQNYRRESALVIAAKNKQTEIVQQILKNDKFNPIESNIDYAFYISNLDELLSCDSLDVNYSPSKNFEMITLNNKKIIKSSFINSIIENNERSFNLIIQHPSFNMNEYQIIDAVYIAFNKSSDQIIPKIFDLLKKCNIDINSRIFNNNSLLIEIIINETNEKMLSYILNFPTFESKKSDIVRAFTILCSQFSISKQKQYKSKSNVVNDFLKTKSLDLLYKYDIKHDRLIDLKAKNEGKSFLTNLYSFIFSERNIDPNRPKENSEYPLIYAIQNNLYILSLCLINSGQIDLNQIIVKNFTNTFGKGQIIDSENYLHLAVKYGRFRILEEILSNTSCNVNITDHNNETPLFEACRRKKAKCIKALFKMDDLDYNHRNNKGQDALQVLKSTVVDDSNHLKSDEIKNKEEYLSKLLELIKLPSKEESSNAWNQAKPKPESNNEKLNNFNNASKSFKSTYHSKSKDTKIANDESKDFDTNKSFNSTDHSKSKYIKNENDESKSSVANKPFNSTDHSKDSEITNEFEFKEQDFLFLDDNLDSIFQFTDTEELIQNEPKLSNDEKTSLITSKEINHSTLEPPESNSSNKESKKPIPENEANSSTTQLPKQNHLTTSDSQLHDRKENSKESKASEKTSQKVTFEMYRESFSEKPDPSFQQKSQADLDKREDLMKNQTKIDSINNKNIKCLLTNKNKDVSHSRSSHRKRKVKKLTEILSEDEDEIDWTSNYNQQLMILQQQQQQWYSMIQLNNQLQAQIDMQMMNQEQMNKKMQKKSKKKK